MSYDVKILCDSYSRGVRLTTIEATFPRFILAEWNTHRMFSRNSASSRAIPTEKIIERVENEPFIPETFNRRVKGMGVGEKLPDADSISCKNEWLHARTEAVIAARFLMETDVDKSRVNRLLEPFMWHTCITTATDWDNFFALRDHPEAQPEFQIIARMIREAMFEHKPIELHEDEWHLPLVNYEDEFFEAKETKQWEYFAWVSAGRCARSSYDKIHDPENKASSYARAEKLKSAGHMSPFEHQARPFTKNELDWIGRTTRIAYMSAPTDESARLIRSLSYSGNLKHWHQFRKTFASEDNYRELM